jgi:hypothetical protein
LFLGFGVISQIDSCHQNQNLKANGYTEPLDDNIEVLVPDDDHGLYAIDILDPSWV